MGLGLDDQTKENRNLRPPVRAIQCMMYASEAPV